MREPECTDREGRMPVDTLAKPYELCFHTGMNIEQKLTEHDYYEILFVLSGHLEMMTLQSVYRNTGPILALIPPRTYHCNMLVQCKTVLQTFPLPIL